MNQFLKQLCFCVKKLNYCTFMLNSMATLCFLGFKKLVLLHTLHNKHVSSTYKTLIKMKQTDAPIVRDHLFYA